MITKILAWLDHHLWPFTRIRVLGELVDNLTTERDQAILARDEAQRAYAQLMNEYQYGDSRHWNQWIVEANRLWSAKAFDHSQLKTMRVFYERGMGWREAIDEYRIYSTMQVDPIFAIREFNRLFGGRKREP